MMNSVWEVPGISTELTEFYILKRDGGGKKKYKDKTTILLFFSGEWVF